MPLCTLQYFSQALVKNTAATILLPDQTTPGPWHVMFLLHGLSDDHTIWSRRTSIERYVAGTPLVVVMPDGGRGFYCDAKEGFAYGKAIGEELPEIIRSYFPTIPGWAIGGLSMGGYGALRLALRYPETFVSANSHSGATAFGHFYPDAENPNAAEFLRIVGPNSAGSENDLWSLASSAKPRPRMRIDCGTEDFLLDANRSFHAFLEDQAIEHEYEEFPGAHDWSYWDDHVQEALQFHMGSFAARKS